MPQNTQDGPSDGPPFTVFIGNLPKYALECDIEMILEGIEYDRIRLIKSKDTDEFKGFAYVDILSDESLQKALQLNNALLDENKIRVNLAENNRPNTQRGGRRGVPQQPNNFQRGGGFNRGGGGGGGSGGRGGNFIRGAPLQQRGGGGIYNHRGSYYTNNHRSNGAGNMQQGFDDYQPYQNFQPHRPSHPNSRPNRFPRQPMRARGAGSSRGMARGAGGASYGQGRGGGGGYGNNWNHHQQQLQAGGRGGGGGWHHNNNTYHQGQSYHPNNNYGQHHPRSRVTSTSSRNNDPLPAPLTEEEKANRPRLNLLPRTVGANKEGGDGHANEFVTTERNVAIFGKSITRSANTSVDISPTATMADPAIISASHMQPASSVEDVEHAQMSSSGDGCSPNSQKSPGIETQPETAPHSFSTPYANEEKPPDMSEHSDSGFRSEDGTSDVHNVAAESPHSAAKHLENTLSALQV